MKNNIRKPVGSLLILFAILQIMTSGCFSTQRLKSSQLLHLEKIQGLTYVVLDKEDPVNHIWTLSNIRFETDHLVAVFKPEGTEFGERIDRIYGNQDAAEYQDHVFIYITPSAVATITDHVDNRLDYTQIQKTLVFEPDPAKNVLLAWVGIIGGAGLYVWVQLLGFVFQ